MDMEKDIKKSKSYSLKPINIEWLSERALKLSKPGSKVSDSALLDRLLDEAREREDVEVEQSPSPTKQPKRRKTDLRSARVNAIAVAI
jgi:hypothetical protein